LTKDQPDSFEIVFIMAPGNKVLIVIAAGPLIGVAVAALFASRGFTHVALLSRDSKRLKEDYARVSPNGKGPHAIVQTFSADVSDPVNLTEALQQVEADFGVPEVIVYNGSRITNTKIGNWNDWSEDDIATDFKVSP
jgi:NAD(P)-dependent dehydrogenase (short-subunit alcohol dehydrogenase family)